MSKHKTFRVAALIAATLFGLATAPSAQAHLMVAQNGTLNLVGDGGFLVLSVPVSALAAAAPVDDDGDGKLSIGELRAHFAEVKAAVEAAVVLEDDAGQKPLQGLIFTLAPPDGDPGAPAAQVVVMGRFALGPSALPLRLHLGLFGARPEERSYRFKVTQGASAQLLMFSPQQASHPLLPSTLSVLLDYTALGAAHILTGVDHLLFLLVVLVSGWRWRQVLLALSCFTLGHATTLAASLWGGVHLSAAIVEPAIAATIVAMALFDWHSRVRLARQVAAGAPSLQTSRRGADLARLALVFSCALIHGLGLASALQELGLDPAHRLTTLVGFNLGIELGQLGVAAAFAGLLAGLRLLRGLGAVHMATQAASVFAMAMGTGWFVQRVLVLS